MLVLAWAGVPLTENIGENKYFFRVLGKIFRKPGSRPPPARPPPVLLRLFSLIQVGGKFKGFVFGECRRSGVSHRVGLLGSGWLPPVAGGNSACGSSAPAWSS